MKTIHTEAWSKSKLGCLAEEVRELYQPAKGNALPYIGLEHVEQESLSLNSVGSSSDTVSTKKRFRTGDILFGSLRPYFRKVVRPKFSGVCSTDITVIRAKDTTAQGFLFYLVAAPTFISFASNISSGTRMPRASWKVLCQSEWSIPPLPTQHKIAAVLSAYDNLIGNNLRRIKVLEEMVQLIYREWFVDFRFPGHEKVRMVNSDLGRIPEGWEIKKTKEVVKRLKAGNTYNMNDVEEIGEVIVVDQSRNEYLGFHSNEADHKASPDKPIIIFGDHTCKMQLMVEPFSVGPNVVPFVAVNNLSIYYVFFLVKDLVSTQEYKRHWTELSNKQVAVSLPDITKQFANLVTPLFEAIETLRKKNINLNCTRDLLVPKLISGELDVSELDIDVEGAPR